MLRTSNRASRHAKNAKLRASRNRSTVLLEGDVHIVLLEGDESLSRPVCKAKRENVNRSHKHLHHYQMDRYRNK